MLIGYSLFESNAGVGIFLSYAYFPQCVANQRTAYRRYGERKCADTVGTVPVPWAGHFQC